MCLLITLLLLLRIRYRVCTVRSKRVNNNIIRWVELVADGSDMQVNL